MKCCIGSTTLYGVANWTLRKLDEEYLESLSVVLEKDGEDQFGRSYAR